jgi:predicted metal-dependent peptidase
VSEATDKRLKGALLRIRGDHPFFGTLALFAEIVVTDEVATAATDGKRLLFNAQFVEKQNPSQLCGLITHELLHAGLQHVLRRRERDPELWNIAADIVVNDMISAETTYTLPEGGVEAPELAHLSVEEIYEQLSTCRTPKPRIVMLDLSDAPTGSTGVIDADHAAELARHWNAAMQQAGAVARRANKGFGRAGTDTWRDAGQALSPSLNWRELLWQFLVATPCDFAGFDRRFVWQKLYLEEVVGEAVDVAIAVDTSGSVDAKELSEFLAEVQGILDTYPQIRGNLFFADTELYGPYPFSNATAIPQPKVGGGTSFVPFFNWVETRVRGGESPVCIYLTDGYGTFPSVAPDVQVLWVVSPGGLTSGQFPFGEVARMASGVGR